MSDLSGRPTVSLAPVGASGMGCSRVRRGRCSRSGGRPNRQGAGRAGRYQREHPDRGRGRGRSDGGVEPIGPLRAGGSPPGRRRQPGDASTATPDVGAFSVNWNADVKFALPAVRGTAQAAASWQQASGGQQRSGDQWNTGQRRVRRGKATQRFIAATPRRSPVVPVGHRGQAVMPRRAPSQTWAGGVFGRTRPQRPDRGGILKQLGEVWTPEVAGSALVELVRAIPATTASGYLLTGAGLQTLP